MSSLFSLHNLLAIVIIGMSLLVGVRFYYYYNQDIFNPVSLFVVGWVLPYGLYIIYPYPPSVQPRLSLVSHALIIGATGSFFLGWSIASSHTPLTFADREGEFQVSDHSLELAIVVMMVLGLIAFVIQFRDVGGIEALLRNQRYYETHFWQAPLIDNIYNLGLIAGIIAVMYALKRQLNILVLMAVSIGLFLSIIPLGRQYMLMYLVLLIVTVNYYWRQFRLLTITGIGAAGIGLIITVVQTLSWGLVSGYIARGGVIISPVVTHLYWYFAMGIGNVEITVSKLGPFGQRAPIMTLEPVWAILFIKDTVGLSNLPPGFYKGWTTPTFIRPFYHDFGIIGVLVGTFLIGYLTTRWYIHLRNERTPLRVFTYGLFAFCLLLMFFTNHFTHPKTLITILQFVLLTGALKLSDDFLEKLRKLFLNINV